MQFIFIIDVTDIDPAYNVKSHFHVKHKSLIKAPKLSSHHSLLLLQMHYLLITVDAVSYQLLSFFIFLCASQMYHLLLSFVENNFH